MADKGLVDVADPSRSFLSQRQDGSVGSVVVATMEGSRPLLVEVQALTSPSMLPTPRRVGTGVDFNRLLLVCAVLTRRAGLSLAGEDVVVNVTGGLRISEPAADLGVALAIASSLRNIPVPPNLAAVGEVGLSGEIRGVPQLDRRIAEIMRIGMGHCLVPARAGGSGADGDGLKTTGVETLVGALAASLPGEARRGPTRS